MKFVLNRIEEWTPRAARIAFASLLILILWGMLSPQDPMPKYFPHQDKIEHLGAFALLAGCGALMLSPGAVWFAAAGGAFLGIGLEFGQAVLTLHREPSWRDAIASVTGCALGVGLAATWRAFSPQLAISNIRRG